MTAKQFISFGKPTTAKPFGSGACWAEPRGQKFSGVDRRMFSSLFQKGRTPTTATPFGTSCEFMLTMHGLVSGAPRGCASVCGKTFRRVPETQCRPVETSDPSKRFKKRSRNVSTGLRWRWQTRRNVSPKRRTRLTHPRKNGETFRRVSVRTADPWKRLFAGHIPVETFFWTTRKRFDGSADVAADPSKRFFTQRFDGPAEKNSRP